eukprot:1147424-Pelagomonas_calceolata.AAC.2
MSIATAASSDRGHFHADPAGLLGRTENGPALGAWFQLQQSAKCAALSFSYITRERKALICPFVQRHP